MVAHALPKAIRLPENFRMFLLKLVQEFDHGDEIGEVHVHTEIGLCEVLPGPAAACPGRISSRNEGHIFPFFFFLEFLQTRSFLEEREEQ